jgi:hypothetical protein
MKVKHHEAERELQHQEKIFREAMEKYDSSCLALVKLALCWPNFGCSFASWVELYTVVMEISGNPCARFPAF